ncbi:MAG TPA: tetratricopeptide repeat protein [Pseudomonadales bacterium]|nr:tetratricopeptide repeat protein [Pseudomonadales bacterium]
MKQKSPSRPTAEKNAAKVPVKEPDNCRLIVGICIFLCLVVWGVFGQTRHFDFVNFDDGKYIMDNPSVTGGMTTKGVAAAFGMAGMDNWVPLTTISHMADCQFYGLKAGGHHLTNIALHGVTVILLFLVLVKLTAVTSSPFTSNGRKEEMTTEQQVLFRREIILRCAFVAAIFAVHPLRAESVAWVSERKDVLCGVFFMLTLWCYAGYAGNPKSVARYLAALFFMGCALMSKPMAVTLPFVLLLIDYWPLGRFNHTSVRRLIVEKLPFLALSLLSCLGTMFIQKRVVAESEFVPGPLRIENAMVSYVTYIAQLFYPAQLAPFYRYPIEGLPFREVAAAFLFLATVTVLVILWRRKRPYLLAGWFWYGIMLVPVIGFVQVGSQAHADRYTYLTEIGLGLMLTWLAADWCARLRHGRVIAAGAGTVILVALIYSAHEQVTYWRNGEALWRHAEDCDRTDIRAYNDLGSYFYNEKRYDDAIAQFKEAIIIYPKMASAYDNLGLAYAAEENSDEAITQYQNAIKADPNYAIAYYNLGIALAKKGLMEQAIGEYQQALAVNSSHGGAQKSLSPDLPDVDPGKLQKEKADIHDALGLAFATEGKDDEAIAQFQEVLKLQPNYPEAQYNLANALLKKGQVNQGVTEFQQAVNSGMDDAKTHNNLGTALRRQGQLDEAIVQYQEALKMDPEYAPAHYNLGNVLLQKGQVNAAIGEYQAALKLKPDSVMVQRNIAHTIWALATSPDAGLRNGTNAVEFARAANQVTSGSNPLILRVLAAAYAESGDFPNAIETAKQALKLAAEQQNFGLENALNAEMADYQKNSPVRADPRDMAGWQ